MSSKPPLRKARHLQDPDGGELLRRELVPVDARGLGHLPLHPQDLRGRADDVLTNEVGTSDPN